jgi:hypothetical protein
LPGLDALSANNQVILAAKLSAYTLDGGAHLARILFLPEIIKWLVIEWALMRCRARPDWSF